MAGAARALLTPRLGASAGNLGAGLGRMGAGTPVRQLRGDNLVHHGGVRLDAEEIVGEFHVAGFGTGERGHRELHSSPPSDALACTEADSLLGGLPASRSSARAGE